MRTKWSGCTIAYRQDEPLRQLVGPAAQNRHTFYEDILKAGDLFIYLIIFEINC